MNLSGPKLIVTQCLPWKALQFSSGNHQFQRKHLFLSSITIYLGKMVIEMLGTLLNNRILDKKGKILLEDR